MDWKEEFEKKMHGVSQGFKTVIQIRFLVPKLPKNATEIKINKVVPDEKDGIKEIHATISSCFDNGAPYNVEIDGGYCCNNHHMPVLAFHNCSFSGKRVCDVRGCAIKIGDKYYAKPYGYFAVAFLIVRFLFWPLKRLIEIDYEWHERQRQEIEDRQREDRNGSIEERSRHYDSRAPYL